jgi:SAM-dependent methyltransferase
MTPLRAGVLAAREVLGTDVAAWDAVLATVARAAGLPGAAAPGVPGLEAWREPGAVDALGDVYESLLADRTGTGSFFTPPRLVAWLLDQALGRTPAAEPHLLDPACGTGNVLVAALRRLGPGAVGRLHGTDVDPVAVAITRLRLRLAAPDVDPAVLERTVRVADGLGEHPDAPFDAVLGNPPFGGRLRPRGPLAATSPAPYTDTSAAFLLHAIDLVRPGGTVALVQPLSLLAARDAGPVRDAVRAAGAVTAFWSTTTPVFAGTPVLTCVPVVVVGRAQGRVATWAGARPEPRAGVPLPDDEWGPLHAPALGIPVVAPRTEGRLGDLGPCSAGFRDEYYGLVPFVDDGGPGAPLVTTGLIEPAHCRWGVVPARFAKRTLAAPTVDVDTLRVAAAGTRLARWVEARLVPKVLVATQGRTVEAVVDEHGDWLPSVPVLTLVPPPDRLWHALAVLLAPPVVAIAAARYAGTAMASGAIKLSAGGLADLPLPADRAAWDVGARLARDAQHAPDAARADVLRACAETMCAAYGDDSALAWWLARTETPVRATR